MQHGQALLMGEHTHDKSFYFKRKKMHFFLAVSNQFELLVEAWKSVEILLPSLAPAPSLFSAFTLLLAILFFVFNFFIIV